jgi:DUF2905 family protein
MFVIARFLPLAFYFCRMDSSTGKYILFAGIALVVLGVIIYFFHDKLHWIGRLPGDIRIERENFKFYFPITTMILLSVGVSLIVYLIRRLW